MLKLPPKNSHYWGLLQKPSKCMCMRFDASTLRPWILKVRSPKSLFLSSVKKTSQKTHHMCRFIIVTTSVLVNNSRSVFMPSLMDPLFSWILYCHILKCLHICSKCTPVVLASLLLAVITDLEHESKSMLTHKSIVFLPVQGIWKEGFPEQKVKINIIMFCYIGVDAKFNTPF